MLKEIILQYQQFNNISELELIEIQLLEEAEKAASKAYAPYSKFKVGCALLLENGLIVSGNNQENASYPLGLCAERVAFFNAGANYSGIKIKSAAIYAESELFEVKDFVSPCGACRQAMSEYEFNQKTAIPLIMKGKSGPIIKTNSVSSLLPLQFNRSSLNQ